MINKPLESYFAIEPVDEVALETPVPVVDLDVVERNVRAWQDRCNRLGLNNRPHIKTHKLIGMAKYQLDQGAAGITVQKLGEAEVMADAGITDMLLTFNVVGAPKLRRLADLAKRTDISVVADNADVVAGLGQAGIESGRAISVLVECETGAARNGVQRPADAANLAQTIDATPGLTYGGLMTYPAPGKRVEAAAWFAEAIDLISALGLQTNVVSTGGSPDMLADTGLDIATEYRAGTNIYCDRALLAAGACTPEQWALKVRATVVSVPTPERAILDSGSKSLTSDLVGQTDFGAVPALNDARVIKLSEEHGCLDISDIAVKPRVGDIVEVVPNHVCPVTNLFDKIALSRGGRILGLTRVDARGKVW